MNFSLHVIFQKRHLQLMGGFSFICTPPPPHPVPPRFFNFFIDHITLYVEVISYSLRSLYYFM